MKLIPRAKPVRIRITSGGKEHFSLDSLKKDFCIDDVKPLLDGRLSRWLRQQGKNGLANDIEGYFPESLDEKEKCLEFIKLFFREEFGNRRFSSLIELAQYWCEVDGMYRKNGEAIYKQLLNSDIDAAKYLYKKDILPNIKWVKVFQGFADQEDPEGLFILGKILFDGKGVDRDIEKGHDYILKAAKLRWEEAVQFEMDREYEKAVALYSVKQHKRFGIVHEVQIKQAIIQFWGNERQFNAYRKEVYSKRIFSNIEYAIIDFVRACTGLLQYYHGGGYQGVKGGYPFYFKDDVCVILEYECTFIKALIKRGLKYPYKEFLHDISDKYEPAHYMLMHDVYPKSLLEGFDFWNASFPEQLEFIVKHIFDF